MIHDYLTPGLSQEELSAQVVETLPDRTAMQLVNISLDLNVPINIEITINAISISIF